MRQPLPLAQVLLDQPRLDRQRRRRVAGAENRLGGAPRARQRASPATCAGRGRRAASARYIGACATRLCGHSSTSMMPYRIGAGVLLHQRRGGSARSAFRSCHSLAHRQQGAAYARRAELAHEQQRRRRPATARSARTPRPCGPRRSCRASAACAHALEHMRRGQRQRHRLQRRRQHRNRVVHGGERRQREQHRPGQRLGARRRGAGSG